MSERRTFPGGLRAQLLLGLTALMIVALAVSAVIVENVLTRRLLENRRERAASTARVIADLESEHFDELVDRGVVAAVVRGEHRSGPAELTDRLDRAQGETSRVVDVDGHPWIIATHASDGGNTSVAIETASIVRDVGQARNVLSLFLLLVVVVVLAFGYGFFGFLILRPVRAIRVATERAAEGDLASPIALTPRNEFGSVARSFNSMLERLDQHRAELEHKVTELQTANRELAQTRDSLIRSEKLASVGQLAAGIAHEIGNPLAALSGYNELLREGDLEPEELEGILERSGAQLERIRTVIRNLLDFSREDEAGEPEPIDLVGCVSEANHLVRALPAARNVEFHLDDVSGPPVMAVAPRVVQVLVNLMMNALDAMGGEGTLRIERHDEGDWAELSVVDDGPGVDPDALGRLFDPFFTTKDPGEGTGLGLAISARIMEAFDGEIRADNAPGGGARFVLVFRTDAGAR